MSVASQFADRVRALAARVPPQPRRHQIRAADVLPGSPIRYCGAIFAVVNVANFTHTVLVTIVNRSDTYIIEYHPEELVDLP
jgi:hypothetical protein